MNAIPPGSVRPPAAPRDMSSASIPYGVIRDRDAAHAPPKSRMAARTRSRLRSVSLMISRKVSRTRGSLWSASFASWLLSESAAW